MVQVTGSSAIHGLLHGEKPATSNFTVMITRSLTALLMSLLWTELLVLVKLMPLQLAVPAASFMIQLTQLMQLPPLLPIISSFTDLAMIQ